MSVNVNRGFYRYKMLCLIAKVEGKGNGIKTVIVNVVDVAKARNRPSTIVSGSHEAKTLQDILDGFIKKFVLCPECENPETDLHVNPKKQTIGNSCKACMLDTYHKLCTFILKNPPENSDSGTGKKEKEKKNREGKTRKMAQYPAVRPHHHHPSETSPLPRAIGEEEDDDWGEDTTEEAQRRRMDEISGHAKVLMRSDDWRGPQRSVKYRRHFLRFCHNNKKAQRYLHGLECVVAMHEAQLLTKIPHILKEMYNADRLEEAVIISWSEKASKKYVSKELAKEIHVKAEPFIKWLKEAEEESSGGEEDENIEVVYLKTASVPKVETVKSDNKDDDIDFDAI
uniref:Eukaryotic translation initiation factor 5 n=1 Tax=Cavia porcellus TaxID=10141 RepID=H0VU61_CAVPO